MSDRQIAKNRFHKGLTAYLRRTLRKVGVSLDEEMAQFALGGVQPFAGEPDRYMIEVINQTFANKVNLMKQWATDNPKRNPYPPSFPERALKLVRDALHECYADDGSPVYHLEKLKIMCEAELSTDPVTIDVPEEN